MNFQIVFTMQDLLLFVLWALIVVVLIYFLRVLSKSLKILGNINSIIKDNKTYIDETIKVVPEITKDAHNISSEIAHDLGSFRDTVDNIAHTSSKATEKLKEDSNIVSGVGSIIHTVSIGKALYDKYFGNKVQPIFDNIKDTIKEVDKSIQKTESIKQDIEKERKKKEEK